MSPKNSKSQRTELLNKLDPDMTEAFGHFATVDLEDISGLSLDNTIKLFIELKKKQEKYKLEKPFFIIDQEAEPPNMKLVAKTWFTRKAWKALEGPWIHYLLNTYYGYNLPNAERV